MRIVFFVFYLLFTLLTAASLAAAQGVRVPDLREHREHFRTYEYYPHDGVTTNNDPWIGAQFEVDSKHDIALYYDGENLLPVYLKIEFGTMKSFNNTYKGAKFKTTEQEVILTLKSSIEKGPAAEKLNGTKIFKGKLGTSVLLSTMTSYFYLEIDGIRFLRHKNN